MLPVDDLRDLLLASMQNTISLTQLSTQQVNKISTITTSLNEAIKEIEQLKSDLSASRKRISDLEEKQNGQGKNLNGTRTEIEGLTDDMSTVQDKIENLEAGESELTARVEGLSWPDGSYCILASGDCPAGFTRHYGHIRAFNTYSHIPSYIQPAVFGDSYMRCHGPCGRHTSWDAEFAITSCCK